MSELFLTEETAEAITGCGRETFEFDGHVRVMNARSSQGFVFGGLQMGAPIDDSYLIPREAWPDLIADKDREQSWLDDMVQALDIPTEDQDGLSWCHGFGPVAATEIAEAVAGNPFVKLSGESVAGRVANWNPNRGGDPEEDLQVLVKYGACPADFLDKPFSSNPKNWRDGWEQEALKHTVREYYIPTVKRWDYACTAALRNHPTSPWFDWWSHCISGSYRLKNEKGTIWRKERNNWGPKFGDNGFLWMAEGTRKGQGTPSGLVIVQCGSPVNDNLIL